MDDTLSVLKTEESICWFLSTLEGRERYGQSRTFSDLLLRLGIGRLPGCLGLGGDTKLSSHVLRHEQINSDSEGHYASQISFIHLIMNTVNNINLPMNYDRALFCI